MPEIQSSKETEAIKKEIETYAKRQEERKAAAERVRLEAQALEGKKKVRALRKAAALEYSENKYKNYVKHRREYLSGAINEKEWKRTARSESKHRWYDRISAVIRAFRGHNKLMDEGTVIIGNNGKELKNEGRIFLGGTKPMNVFKGDDGITWLCKEAVTCVGTVKETGALVSEAASKLQSIINPDTAIPCFAYRDENGKTLGSLQQRIELKKDAIDLFKWQTDRTVKLDRALTSQILREHVTDWLLCNYDTKGENFLTDTEGRIRGIDKEQAFSYLKDPGAQKMSMDYSPNPNETLYDTMFRQYAKGKDSVDLDLQAVVPYVQKLEKMDDKQYLETFRDVIKNKCGDDKKKTAEMEQGILVRKQNIREQYRTLFTEIVKQRGEDERLNEKGTFRFTDEPVAEKQEATFGKRPLGVEISPAKTHEKEVRTEKEKEVPAHEEPEL